MAASTLSRAEFGHYLLPLTMNKCQINAKEAKFHIEVKTKYLDLKKDRPERHALRNLLGMLHFRLEKFDESLVFFDKILSDGEDPENLNALANKKYICDKLYRIRESRDLEQKISELLPNDYQDEGEESRLRRARSLAEQAFAYSFDVFGESVTTERYQTSVDLYDEAFELAGDSITEDDREDWMISKGMACHKIFTAVKWDKSMQNEARSWFEKAVNIFVCIKDTNNDILKSDSWRHLGELFQDISKYSTLVPDNLTCYEPKQCYKEALDSTPQNPKMLARYAKFLKTDHQLEEALECVHKSIQLDETVFNYFAFSIRGQIFLLNYKKQLTAKKRYISNRPDDNLLIQARNDFEKLAKSHSTPVDLEKLAQVFYYMGTDCHGNVKDEGQMYLNQALTMCAKAVACQDGEERSDVHTIRGQSLCALGEHQQSLISLQRAVECKSSNNWFSNSGYYLALEYAHVLKNMTGAQPSSHLTLFADMVNWLHKAAEIYLMNPRTSSSLAADTHLASHWVSFVKYCRENNCMRKLEDIKKASLYPDERHLLQEEESHHSRNVTEEASWTRHVNSDEDHNPHAPIYVVPQKRRTQRATEEANWTRRVNSGEDHNPHAPIEASKAPYVVPQKRRAQSVNDKASVYSYEDQNPLAPTEAATAPVYVPTQKHRTQIVTEESGATEVTSDDYHQP